MPDFLHKYLTTEAVLALSGSLWALLGYWSLAPTEIDVPAMLGITQPFTITPGVLIALVIVPVMLKTFKPGATPFVAATPNADKPKEEGL